MMEWVEFTGKTVDDALTEALIQLQTTSDKVEYEVLEKESTGILRLFNKPARIRVRKKEESINDIAEGFLMKVFEQMQVDARLELDYNEEEKTLSINAVGSELGILIGKRGQTLDSLQYLTSLVVNKDREDYVKIKLDTENYRQRRRETLENLAKNISFKVKRTKRPVALEPMNPYERRVIHSALQYDKFVETHSEGDEPYRHVVITLKKNYRDYSSSRGGSRYYNNNNNRDYHGRNYHSKEYPDKKETIPAENNEEQE